MNPQPPAIPADISIPPARRGPSLRAPLLTTLISLAVAVALAVVASVFAGPHLADIFRVIASSGPADAETLRAPIQNILSPGMFLLGSVAALASITFSVASLWLLIAIIIRLTRR
jgi:hypothetical protein